MKIEHTVTSRLNTEFFENRPYFWWWIRDKKALSVESIVEGVLAYGNMNDVYNLFKIVGREKVKQIFFRQIQFKRCNYTPRTINFFKKVFMRNV
jgi:hypothetical protein